MEDIPALVHNIKQRLESAAGPVIALWLKLPGERRIFAQEVLDSRGNTPIVPLLVKGGLLQNANALLDDLVELIDQNRAEFAALPKGESGRVDRCAILLLANNELGLPQISSPACLPEWFPVGGGREVSISIEDVTWKVEAPLDVAALRIEQLSVALLRLDTALLDRVEKVRAQDHNRINGFFDLIRRDKESFAEFLAGARAELSVIRADAFRPSAREGRSLTVRLWILVRATTPDQLNGRAEALARALALPETLQRMPHESLLTVLGRPTHQAIPATVRIARNILASVFGACQLVTAVHHAGDYGEYPLALMRTVGFDLLRALVSSEEVLAKATGSSMP